MNKILISIPDAIVQRMRATIPPRQRSKIIVKLIEKEIEKRERALYECALAVEKDISLNKEMQEWNITAKDGLADESW